MVSQITFRKMSNIYLTLVSDVTKKYTSNVANQFKVKPQLRIPGEGWKVSVAGAILPKNAFVQRITKCEHKFNRIMG